ncbi:type IV secretion protein Rhs [Catellatospora sp. IY07-71]|uniref:RHS repeat-associated core domain-containing protein n=1 Tax=Catellatospora sp. IY07-71 TaxID=2728827 RepID=UPI001BB460E8|nr:RHS repeat-associated core domain-containing protein [Catellatospora sp. IY07-71]BCJ74736.1 type IV secretion protein Rhs [Catellatospora sp. IY07-71]
MLGTIATAVSGLTIPAQAAPPEKPVSQQVQKLRDVAVGPGSVAKARAGTAVRGHQPAAPRWPAASDATVELAPARTRLSGLQAKVDGPLPVPAPRVRAGSSPVWLAAGTAGSPMRVSARVLDREQAVAAGRDLLVRLAPVGAAATGSVEMSLDISGFKTAYGADWSDRLRLVVVPECAAGPECAAQPLATARSADTLTARVPLTAGGTMIALSAGSDSAAGSGDFSATSLVASSTWSAGGSSGNFSWSYGLRMPPSLGGPTPDVNFDYASQAVDGRTAATNNQPSWVGEGFDWEPGYVERRYISCSEDMTGSPAPNNTTKTGDLCWRGSNATLSLNGRSTELFYNATEKLWHGRSEDGSKVELKYGAANGDEGPAPGTSPSPGDAGEHWVVTTTDGTKYFFGLNRLQGWTSGKEETNSVQTVPVFGNHSPDPCHATTFLASDCLQAYRWNLDYVVDPHGNTMSLWWGRDTNKYGMNMSETDLHTYTRDAYLKRIDYGTHQRTLVNNVKTDTVYTSKPVPMRVEFATGDRCLSNCTNHGDNWSDTPWDLSCTSSPCDDHSPTYWSTRRLSQVTTQIWDTATTQHKPVEQWTLTHSYPDPGDGTRAGMWLEKIQRTGLVEGTTPAAMPVVKFDPVMLANRVDTALKNGLRPMNWARMSAITNETGGVVSVTYKATECVAGALPTAHTNVKRCYPVRWAPPDLGGTPGQEITDWFHKYVVEKVAETDGVLTGAAASSSKVTRYDYVGGAAWRYTEDDAFTKDKYRTWNQWRGYATVRTYVGEGADQTRTDTSYFRGMHGDKAGPSGGTDTVTLTDGKGLIAATYPAETIYDHDEFAGMPLESAQYDSPTGNPISGTVSKPWRSDPATASRTIDGQTLYARFVDVSDEWTWGRRDTQPVSDRVTRTQTKYDSLGMAVEVTRHGDLSKTGDEQCTAISYLRNSNLHLMNTPHRTRTWALTCADALTTGRAFTKVEIVGEVRTSYDDQAWGAVPTVGEPTRVEAMKDWVNNAFVPLTTTRSAYDDYGRLTDTWDVDGKQTTTGYLPAADAPVTSTTVTSPFGLTTTTKSIHPAWGVTTAVVEVTNSRRTDVTYDALGRVEKVWRPGRLKSLYPNTPSSWFVYGISNTAPSFIETKALSPTGVLVSSYQFYDGLSRPRQTQAVKKDGTSGAMVSDTFYDSAGRAWRTFGPYPVSAAPSAVFSPHPADDQDNIEIWNRTVFDGAGRPAEQIRYSKLVEQWRTSTRYPSVDRTEVTPPDGGTVTSTVVDALGRTAELWQHHGTTAASSYDKTVYTYDGRDHLTRIVNQAQSKWEFEYDLLGRQTKSTDPDKGITATTYDNAGRPESVTDGRTPAVTLRYTYDQQGRKTGLYHGSVTPANRLAKWDYDQLSNAKGMLTSSTRYVGGEAGAAYTSAVTAISPFGTISQQIVTIPSTETGLAGSYQYDFSYRADGSPATQRLPAIGSPTGYNLGWETQTTTYSSAGMPQTLGTGTTSWLVTGTGYTEHGEVGVITLRDQTANPQLQIGQYYDSQTRRMNRVWTTRDTAPTTVSDLYIGYDDAGGVTQLKETSAVAGVETQCFDHDQQRRLLEAWTLASGDCGAVPTAFSSVGGVEKYWLSWTVDSAGNRTRQIRRTSAGTVTTKHVYPAATAARPHALTRTTDAADVTTGSYTYDTAGNTRCRPAGTALNNCTSGSGSQTLTWDAEGRLQQSVDSTGTTSFIYDADGNRLIRKDPTGKTLYLPGQELRVNPDGTAVISCVRYYAWAGRNIATRSSSAAGVEKLTWMVADRQNTTTITVNATGSQAVSVKRQDPYGNPRGGVTGTWPTGLDKGFVGGTSDNTGLIHLGARDYDAGTGRFVTVDPLLVMTDPQQLNGYSYAGNSPVVHSDPSGRTRCDYGDCADPSIKQNYVPPPSGAGKKTGGGSTSPKKPTIKDVIKGTLDLHAQDLGFRDFDHMMEVGCQDFLSPAHCRALEDGLRRALDSAGGKPFDCNAFPDPERCFNDLEGWLKKGYKHIEFSVGYCGGICMDIEFQHGVVQFVPGLGPLPGWGGAIVWNTLLVEEQGPVGADACGADIVGPCFGVKPKVDHKGDWVGWGWEFGVSFGVGEVKPAISYNMVSWDLKTGEWSGPPDPLPPSFSRFVRENCRNIWWC